VTKNVAILVCGNVFILWIFFMFMYWMQMFQILHFQLGVFCVIVLCCNTCQVHDKFDIMYCPYLPMSSSSFSLLPPYPSILSPFPPSLSLTLSFLSHCISLSFLFSFISPLHHIYLHPSFSSHFTYHTTHTTTRCR
jgi:hypothetical protein